MKKILIQILIFSLILSPLSIVAQTGNVTPPYVATLPVEQVSDTTALLRGVGRPSNLGLKTTVYFRYSPMEKAPVFCNEIYGNSMKVSPDIILPAGQGDFAFSYEVENLKPDTIYYYCAIISDLNTIAYGTNTGRTLVESFRTLPCQTCDQTTIKTLTPTVVNTKTVSLRGEYGSTKAVKIYFEYREILDDQLEQALEYNDPDTRPTVSWIQTPKDSRNARTYGKYNYTLKTLRADTDYRFRAVAEVGSGDNLEIFYGAVKTFKTPKADTLSDSLPWDWSPEPLPDLGFDPNINILPTNDNFDFDLPDININPGGTSDFSFDGAGFNISGIGLGGIGAGGFGGGGFGGSGLGGAGGSGAGGGGAGTWSFGGGTITTTNNSGTSGTGNGVSISGVGIGGGGTGTGIGGGGLGVWTGTWTNGSGGGTLNGLPSSNGSTSGTWVGGNGNSAGVFNGMSGTGTWNTTNQSNGTSSGTWSGLSSNHPDGVGSGTWTAPDGSTGTWTGVWTNGVGSGTWTGNGTPNGISTNGVWNGGNGNGARIFNGVNGRGVWSSNGTDQNGIPRCNWTGTSSIEPGGSQNGTWTSPTSSGTWLGIWYQGIGSGTCLGGSANENDTGPWIGSEGDGSVVLSGISGTGTWNQNQGNGTATWQGTGIQAVNPTTADPNQNDGSQNNDGDNNNQDTNGDGVVNEEDTLQIGSIATPPNDAIVRYREGVETVFARQISKNRALAERYGFKEGMNIEKFSWYLAHIFSKNFFGYVNENGQEIRVSRPDVSAYELRQIGNRLYVYEYYKEVIIDIRSITTDFKVKNAYEYYFFRRRR